MAARLPALALLTAAFAATAAAADLPLAAERKVSFETDSATWMSLDVSPDGSRIVTDVLGDIYVLPVAGGEAVRLTSGMGVDTQPTFSPDGQRIAFVSDRSGAESLWVAAADGSQARQLSFGEDDILASPEWSADGKTIFVSRYLPPYSAYELWRFEADSPAKGRLLVSAEADGSIKSSLGAWPTPDGQAVLFARAAERLGEKLPAWSIVRRDLATGEETVQVKAPASPRTDLILGSFFRPVLSPDGKLLAYGSRSEGQTGIRLLDLTNGRDRWLAYPVQHDSAEASSWLDLLPRYDFTPDGRALLVARGAGIARVDVASGAIRKVPFKANVSLDIGPSLRTEIKEESGPVRARLIQDPVPSPDGDRIAFSALGRVYVMPMAGGTVVAVSPEGVPAFMPSWSPDGRQLAFVSWTARDEGHVWTIPATGGLPRRISATSAYYSFPVFCPDGEAILALRSSSSVRMHSYMEYGAQRQAELVSMPATGGAARIVASGSMGGRPHFTTADPDSVYVGFDDGLNRVALDGSGRKPVLKVTGPGWYFSSLPGTADDVRISPDGKWALAQFQQQLHLINMPAGGDAVDLAKPSPAHRRITDIGADFIEWSADGRTLHWGLGSTFHSQPLSGGEPRAVQAKVTLPRDVPKGALLLRGATLLTMRGDEAIADGDLLIVDNRIAALGRRGSLAVPAGTQVRDVSGRFIMPGLIDTHDHYADVRRGVLDFESWGPRANLAYGVTTGFDPSTLSIDTLAYQDAVDAGLMVGSRMPSTGPAIFSFNRFASLDEVRSVLKRYRDHYRTRNLKQYRTGNRQVRQWIAQASNELGMMPTAEGGLALKLDLTQIIDGYPGHEHALPAVPLGRDYVQLMAQARTSYTATLQIGNGGPGAQDYFIVRDQLADDDKLNRFSPRFVVNVKTRERTWRHLGEYIFPAVAAGATAVKRASGLVGMGSHGEMPGIAMHWEMEAHVMGGMTPLEALHSATMGSAETIGRVGEFGSLEPGKFADLIILAKDPRADIRNSLAIAQVMKNGRLYDGDTLDEQWPTPRALPEPWYRGDDLPAVTAGELPVPPPFQHPH